MQKETRLVFFGQIDLFSLCRDSKENRGLMAKIALIVGGRGIENHVGLHEIISQLSWRENQVVLATLFLRANTSIEWSEEDAQQLQEWACEI